MDFKELIKALSRINNDLREQAIRAVNVSLTLRNWFFGFYILEFEQNGNDRAEYGKKLLKKIANQLKLEGIPNSNERELRRYRQFYSAYPHVGKLIVNTLNIRDSLNPEVISEINLIQIRGLPSPEFIYANPLMQIRGTTSPELSVPDPHYIKLLSSVSYSHLVELIRIDDPMKRLFY